ncbi:hypothetical protein ANN_09033 [Periplaneta americana]|uniref:Reverse transcriptase domain-containing protein n=1 Tax=Periplaneta americana TaxID=6978 RepID=A0ABQ8TKP6_PERAM|nr:hypothetical protein ANN_09033 [Periplaneta americana]
MDESRNACRLLVGRPRRRREDNIKMDLREVGYDAMDWINLARNRNRWRAYFYNLVIFYNDEVRSEDSPKDYPAFAFWLGKTSEKPYQGINNSTIRIIIIIIIINVCAPNFHNSPEEQRLRVFENNVLRKIFGAKRDEVTGEWRKLHNAELHALYSSPDIIRNIKSRRLRWVEHVACMGESRNAYRVSKIIVNGNILEQVSHFNYLGCDISFNYEKDIEKKVNRFQMICGTIGRTLGRKARKETQMKFYKVMAVPTLIYGSESWTTTKKEESRIQSAEMKFMRYVRRYTKADKIKNETIRSDLNIFSVHDMVEENKTKWKDHVDRMAENRLPKKIMNYRPIGKRDLGRPRKRWLDDRDRNR